MNNGKDGKSAGSGQYTVDSLSQQFLKTAPARLAEIVRIGALPHWLDEGIVSVLFPNNPEPGSVLEELQRLRFVTQAAPGQFVYQSQVRDYMLSLWPKDQPDLFRQLSARLAGYCQSRTAQPGSALKVFLPEYIYHLLVAEPSDGIAQLGRLFEGSVEALELGLAERLSSMAEERRTLLGQQVDWLGYYNPRLALARYEIESAIPALSQLVKTAHDPYLVATAHRALGQALVQNNQWGEGIENLRRGLEGFNNLRDNENVAWTRLSLGDAYRVLAASLGGIYEERRDFRGLQLVVHIVADLPFLIYRRIADMVDVIPKFYGANYQNWIVLRLLRSAADAYREAEKSALTSNDERLKVEILQRLADVDLELGRPNSAEKRYLRLLSKSVVQSSPYRSASISLGMARLELLRNERLIARQHLKESLMTFTRMGDSHRAGETGYLLGRLYERENELSEAVNAYAEAIVDTTRAKDSVLRTEIRSALNRLTKSPDFLLLPEEDRKRARYTLVQVEQQVFLARFPGRIQEVFTALSGVLTWFLALGLAVLSGVTPLFVEGIFRNFLSERPVHFGLINSIAITLIALVPFFALWIRHLLYVLTGLFTVRFLLPFTRIEQSRPQMYILDHVGLVGSSGRDNENQVIAWRELDAVIVADRLIWGVPSPLLSRTLVIAGNQRLLVTGTTHNYQDLQEVIAAYGTRENPATQLVRDCSFEIVRHWWLGVALGLAVILASVLVFRFGAYQYFCPTLLENGVCPTTEYRLKVAPLVMLANIFFVLIFGPGTLIRSINLERCVRQAIKRVKRSVSNGKRDQSS
jgi:tetratricopeptide (TPR) repeat protein